MKIIAAIDDRNGLMFNQRRQSRDRILTQHIFDICKGHTLWVNMYTFSMFANPPAYVIADDDFLRKAAADDYCWIENVSAAPFADAVTEVIIFRWNRRYPGDFFFDLDLSSWHVTDTIDFPGSSHANITQETYIR